MTYYLDNFCGSQFWDLNLTWHTEQPDLTPCFEKTILLWIPGIILAVFLPLELYAISRSRTKHIPWSWLNTSKVIVVGLMMALTLASLAYYLLRGEYYPADITAPLVQFCIFGIIICLVVLHRSHGMQVSYLLFFISLFLVVFETPYLYSIVKNYPDLPNNDVMETALKISICALQGVFFFLQWFCDKKPMYSEYPNLERPSPELSVSVFSRLTITWFTPFVQLGARKPLTVSDMYSLDHENSSRVIVPAFERNWNETLQKTQTTRVNYDKGPSKVGFHQTVRPRASLLPALFKTFGPTLLFGTMLKLFQDIVLFVNPQLLKLLIAFVSGEEPMWKGYMFASLMFVASIAQMFLLNRYFILMNFLGCRIYSVLVSVVYKKALKLSNNARKQSTLGEIVNLMAVDAAGFQMMTVHLNLLWSAPFQMLLAIYFIYQLLGVAVFAGLAVMILMIPINIWLVRQNRKLQIKQMKKKDERIKTLNEVLSGIKVLKLYSWEPSFEDKISNIRKSEVNILKKAILYSSVGGFIMHLSPFLVALASFSFYVLSDEKNILDAQTAFVSLSLFNILRMPLNMLPQVINSLVMTSVALKRLNNFLNNEELDVNAVQHESSERDPIVVENGTFSWDTSDDSSVVLRNICLSVPQGSLVAVVGTVGSGKSSLISAILGEMDKLSGRVNTKGKIAYVPQQAWMQNASLQKNITCIQEMDKVFLKKVVRACALEHDLEVLPGGYDTEIGEKGINLSGGQKQRISLARAVYSNADIYLLDDPLSAVDSHVGKHIFDSVIGSKGMLRKKTRVLVTHAVTFLPEADLIIVLKDGQVSESGNYKQLVTNQGDFADFLLQYLAEADDEEASPDLEVMKEELLKDSLLREKYQRAISVRSEGSHKSLQRQVSSASSTHEGSTPSTRKGSKSSLNKNEGNEKNQYDKRQLMTTEDAATGSVKLSVFVYYLRAIGLSTAFAGVTGFILYQLLSACSNLWLSEWTSDNSTVVNGTQDMSRTHFYLSVYASFGILLTVCNIVAQLSVSMGCLYAAAWLHARMLQHILRAPMSYFDTTPLGRIVNRFSKDISSCDNILAFNISVFLNLGTQLVATVGVISFSMPLFIVVFVPVMIFNLLLQRFFVSTSRQLKRLESTTKSPVYSHFGETVQGAQSIRAYNMQDYFIAESEQKMDLHQSCNFPNMICMRWLAIRLESASNLIVFFTALFTVVYRGNLDPGLAGLSVAYALQITSTLNFFVRTSADVETNIVSVERIKEYSEIVQEAPRLVEPKPEPAWPSQGKLEFREFNVRYREGLELVLDRVSFSVHPGEKVGIVGRTGAGKSSLTLALFRILEAAGGAIYIDGVNIASVGLHHLRSRLTIIPQDPVLFSGSLRSNLDPFNRESDEALWRALELSNLKPFVSNLPAGLNHQITEGGDNLSVGQKQLVCLSRALLRKTRVLVLDEATAAVDLETDDIIQNTIRNEFKDSTILTIAHRLNTILDYDRILVLERGRVKEFDSPDKLLKDSATVFHSMAKDAGLVS